MLRDNLDGNSFPVDRISATVNGAHATFGNLLYKLILPNGLHVGAQVVHWHRRRPQGMMGRSPFRDLCDTTYILCRVFTLVKKSARKKVIRNGLQIVDFFLALFLTSVNTR